MTLIAPRTARRRTSAAGRAQDAFATVFLSELGWIALAFRGETLAGLTFGQATGRDALAALRRVLGDSPVECVEREACRGTIRDVVDRLERYAAGEAVEFRRVAIDQSHLTPFARRVVAACRRIPAGQTRSYGALAALCGSPGAARAVGRVMAGNRYPLVVPCHRVVGAGGSLGGFSAPQGLAMKRKLLKLEAMAVGR